MTVKQPASWDETKEELNETLEETFSEFDFTPSIMLACLTENNGKQQVTLNLCPLGHQFGTAYKLHGTRFETQTAKISSDCATEFWDDVENTAKNMVEDFISRFRQELNQAHNDICDGCSKLEEMNE